MFVQKELKMAETWKTVAYVEDVVSNTLFDAQSVLISVADNSPAALVVAEQEVVGRLTGGDVDGITIGISDNNMVQIDGTANDTEHAIFNAAGLEGLTDAELLAALSGDAAAAFSFNGQEIQDVVVHVVADDAAKATLTQSVGMVCFQTDELAIKVCTVAS